jgi:hypothetical protein
MQDEINAAGDATITSFGGRDIVSFPNTGKEFSRVTVNKYVSFSFEA